VATGSTSPELLNLLLLELGDALAALASLLLQLLALLEGGHTLPCQLLLTVPHLAPDVLSVGALQTCPLRLLRLLLLHLLLLGPVGELGADEGPRSSP